MFRDYVISLIRTMVPVWVGSALTYLAIHTGITVDSDASAGLVVFLTALLISGYYITARTLQERWPWVGKLLGSGVTAEYPQVSRDMPHSGTRWF